MIDDLIPKKEPVYKIRLKDNGKVDLFVVNKQIICYKYIKDYIFPLRFLQAYPNGHKKVQVDKGAIKFVLNGADIMCQGLTSQGGFIQDDLQIDDIVLVFAESMSTPIGIGKMVMSEKQIRVTN